MVTNQQAWKEACGYFPGGVNSPVRAFRSVGGVPPFIARGAGSRVTDIEGKSYIDYVGSWGPLILGHADPGVVAAVAAAAAAGTSFGAPTTGESELASLIQEAFPELEKMRLVSSGTEATMSAMRVARGFTGRDIIIKCDGGYHGHGDSLLVSAGSGVATLGIPGCPGIPAGIAATTVVVPYNDSDAVRQVLADYPGRVAAMIIEPVCGNMGVVPPIPGYLATLRDLLHQEQALLIFDEVMTGFRALFGGVSRSTKIVPDLCCLGKVVGGGLPLAVYGGRQDIMSCVAPDGPVYQAGTLSGNPVAVAAGIATLRRLRDDPGCYATLAARTDQLCIGLAELLRQHDVPGRVQRFGSMFTLFFRADQVLSYADAGQCDLGRFNRWFQSMLKQGIYLAPSAFEAAFISTAHSAADIDETLAAADRALAESAESAGSTERKG